MQVLQVHVVLAPDVTAPSSRDDAHVSGVYFVEVDGALDDAKAASAALDIFHSRMAVDYLDDFLFHVERDGVRLEEDPDHAAYSLASRGGSVWRAGWLRP